GKETLDFSHEEADEFLSALQTKRPRHLEACIDELRGRKEKAQAPQSSLDDTGDQDYFADGELLELEPEDDVFEGIPHKTESKAEKDDSGKSGQGNSYEEINLDSF
ncbi:MAG TPA: hypothetical protein PLR39_02250, partial [Treponemataceae bacterium]|nr:hypothetical protein [Treponemataceae bacterium]